MNYYTIESILVFADLTYKYKKLILRKQELTIKKLIVIYQTPMQNVFLLYVVK